MFQFPRKFPNFVPKPSTSTSKAKSEDDAAFADLSLSDVKPDSDAVPAPRRRADPPPWGRFGTRQEKAARWSEHAGRIGELCVHQSGKVTLRLAGDLRYEVRIWARAPLSYYRFGTPSTSPSRADAALAACLRPRHSSAKVLPAAQPSFLQEIAVLDHPSKRPAAATNGKAKKHESSASESSSSSASESESASDLSDIDVDGGGGGKDSDADAEKKAKRDRKKAREAQRDQKRKQKAQQDLPADSLILLGQTSKKFIVVPDMQDLLDKVGREERAEKEAERKAKLEKAQRAAALAKKREGTAAPRR